MPNHRQLVNIRLLSALDDLFDRRIAPRNRYRSEHPVLAAGILEAQRQIAFVGFHVFAQDLKQSLIDLGRDFVDFAVDSKPQKHFFRRLILGVFFSSVHFVLLARV